LISALLRDFASGVRVGLVAGRFHHSLAEAAAAVARRSGIERVVLSGGCFQNALLMERTAAALRRAGFAPYFHQHLPANDGGLSLGQIAAAARQRIP
jgi:hydrogenase maturation protein HypF